MKGKQKMSRKILVSLTLVLIMSMFGVVYAGPTDGCYATASASTIKEDENVTITVECVNVALVNNAFGFQFKTTRTGDFVTASEPTQYSAGTFSNTSTGATSGVITGNNSLSGLYAVTRKGTEVATATDFTLGTYDLTAEDNLTVDGSIIITMTDADFILSDDQGAEIADMLRDINDFTVTVTNIDLGWFSGDMVVQSDVSTISSVNAFDFVLGDKDYSVTSIASYTNTFNMDATHQYQEDGTPASDGTLNISASADMTGHLSCSNTINLGDTGSSIDVDTKVGTTGVIVLKAGDANDDNAIDNTDATAIGANLGTNPGDDKDINGDDTLNILDLVHIGRNFGAASGTCGTGS